MCFSLYTVHVPIFLDVWEVPHRSWTASCISGRLADFGWLVCWLIDWLLDWLIVWLLDWLIEWLIGLLMIIDDGWLVQWLVDSWYLRILQSNSKQPVYQRAAFFRARGFVASSDGLLVAAPRRGFRGTRPSVQVSSPHHSSAICWCTQCECHDMAQQEQRTGWPGMCHTRQYFIHVSSNFSFMNLTEPSSWASRMPSARRRSWRGQ